MLTAVVETASVQYLLSDAVKDISATEYSLFPEFFLDPKQLLYLAILSLLDADPVLNLAYVRCHREVGDECIFRLTGTVGDDAGCSLPVSRSRWS